MNSPENNPPSAESSPRQPLAKRSHRRSLLVLLVWLVVCGGILTTVVRAIQAAIKVSRWAACSYHLEQIGRGLVIFDTDNGSLPPAYLCDDKGKPIDSWQTLVAPYKGHYRWRGNYSLKEPWDGPNNRKALSWVFDELRCPNATGRDRSPLTVDYVAVIGPDTMWPGRDRVNLVGGGQDTILLIEMADSDCRFWNLAVRPSRNS